MVLDRNGKLVEPFRKKFTSNNVLPLSVFDYDKNRNYRFIISYDNKIEMFDNKMKPVKGFKLNKTKSNIKSSPQHIRIGTKDYIVLNEENGKLHIVNRQGKDRTKVKNNFNFTKSSIFTYKNHLLFLDDRAINSVNIATGKTKKETLLSGTDYHFNQLDAIRVSLEDQKLKIKDKSYELEFGTYTSPEIFYQNKKYYISITNIETQQVYLFDTNAKLMAKFPVFGKSKIDIKSNLFATKGEGNNVLIYKL